MIVGYILFRFRDIVTKTPEIAGKNDTLSTPVSLEGRTWFM